MDDDNNSWFWKLVILGLLVYGGYKGYTWYSGNYGTTKEREAYQLQKYLDAEKQKAAWEKECEDKGLHFKGLIDDKVECRP